MSVCVAIKIFARYVAVFSCAGIFWGENKEKVIGELWVNKVGINRKEESVVRCMKICKYKCVKHMQICKTQGIVQECRKNGKVGLHVQGKMLHRGAFVSR